MIIDDIAFRSLLGKGEHIQYVAHVHPFTIYPQLFKVMIAGVIMPAGAYFLFPPFYVVWAIWGGLGVLLFLYRVLQWYLDAWIVTNYGVIDQDWQGIFERTTTRIEHGNIEGITNEVKGFWGTVLRYGKIEIEHMSGAPVVLQDVAAPRKLEKEIIRHQQEFTRQQNFQDQNKLKDLLTNLLRSAQ